MRLYLIVGAALLLVWALILLVLPPEMVFGTQGTVLTRALGTGTGLIHLVMVIGLLFAAREPAQNLAMCVAAILLFGVKTFFDLYGLLTFPPTQALVCIGDLWLCAGLFVFLLREMPALLKVHRASQ